MLFTFFPNFDFQVVSEVKGQKMAQNDKKYVCCTPYCMKHTSYDCDFWYTCVKWWQIFFNFFKIFILWLVRGVKGKEMAQNGKKISVTPYLRSRTSYNSGFWYTCVKWWYLQQFFSIFRFLMRGGRGKRAIMTHNYQF